MADFSRRTVRCIGRCVKCAFPPLVCVNVITTSLRQVSWDVEFWPVLRAGATQSWDDTVRRTHYNDVIMRAMASQFTGVSVVYSTTCSGEAQRKHQSSASLPFVRGIHRWPMNYPHKWPVTRKMFPFVDVIMSSRVKRSAIRIKRNVIWTSNFDGHLPRTAF